MFTKILLQMYLWRRKSPLNVENHTDFGSPGSGFGIRTGIALAEVYAVQGLLFLVNDFIIFASLSRSPAVLNFFVSASI